MEKIRVFAVTYGGETVVADNLENAVEQLTGDEYIHEIDPEDFDEEKIDIQISIYYMDKKEYLQLPEYQ